MEKRDSLNRFISDNYSKDDYLQITESFSDDELYDLLSEDAKQLWDKFEYEKISEVQRLTIQRKIESKLKYDGESVKPSVVRRIYKAVNRVAAILIVPLIIVSIFLFYQINNSGDNGAYAEIYCPHGTRTKFDLPDGSSGWLNSGSKIKYSAHFKKNRQVELDGEAFFDVVKNEKKPFKVSTKHFNIKVLGTKFNVDSYNNDNNFAVTLESGKVKIFEKNSSHNLTLKPGYQFAFDKANWDASLNKVYTQFFTSWKDGQMIFRKTPFSEVLHRLGRWYNVDFICSDERLLNLPYRATFKEETLSHVLDLLTLTAPIKYEVEKPKELPDGTYEKQRIYIKRK